MLYFGCVFTITTVESTEAIENAKKEQIANERFEKKVQPKESVCER